MAQSLKPNPVPAPVSDTPRHVPATEPSAENLMSLFAAAGGEEEDTPAPATDGDDVPAETPSDTPSASEEEPAEEPVTDDEEPTPTEETAETPTLYAVVVNGETQQVSLDELLAGYSRTGDYTRKTQEVAENRRRLEAEASAMRADRERYVDGLKNIEGLLAQSGEEPDWTKLAETVDPVEFNKQRAQWDVRQQRMNALRTQRAAEEQRMEADRQAQLQDQIRVEHDKLYAAIPEWTKDRDKAAAEQRDIVDYALRVGEPFGVTPEAIGQITTAFPMLMLRKAMLYDKMMATKSKVVPQKVPTPTAKPGAKVVQTKVSPVEVAAKRLRETGDNASAEEYFLQRILTAKRG